MKKNREDLIAKDINKRNREKPVQGSIDPWPFPKSKDPADWPFPPNVRPENYPKSESATAWPFPTGPKPSNHDPRAPYPKTKFVPRDPYFDPETVTDGLDINTSSMDYEGPFTGTFQLLKDKADNLLEATKTVVSSSVAGAKQIIYARPTGYAQNLLNGQTLEADPNGKSLNSLGAKADAGKNRVWLCVSGFSNALERVSEVTTEGAFKYTPNGWVSVENAKERYMDAFARHMLKLGEGEVYDNGPNGIGTKHLAQMIWNLLAVLELEERNERSTDKGGSKVGGSV